MTGGGWTSATSFSLRRKVKRLNCETEWIYREEDMFVLVSFRGTYEVPEEGAVVSKLRERERNGFLANTNISTDCSDLQYTTVNRLDVVYVAIFTHSDTFFAKKNQAN